MNDNHRSTPVGFLMAGVLVCGLLMLSGCTTPESDSGAPNPSPRPPAATSPTRGSTPPTRLSDQCGAAAHRALIGRPRTEIPVPVDPSRRRVACTTCAVTEDYRPDRLNFFYNADNGLIEEINCG